MPIYEYVCSSCDSKFEMIRSMSKANEGAECPHCKHDAERALSTFACFSSDESGMTTAVAGGGHSCSSCASGSCATCAG